MKIVAAAVKDGNGLIHFFPRPCRHHHTVHALHRPNNDAENDIIEAKGTQGFVTSDGTFVDRVEGARIAIEAGQIKALKWPPYLYSEDLW